MSINRKSKAIGYEWDIDYRVGDGPVETMSIFGKKKIEEAIADAQQSLNVNYTQDPEYVIPTIVGARRADVPQKEVTDG